MSGDWPEWKVATRADLQRTGAKGFLIGDDDWPFRGFVVARGDEIHAYANICPHQRHALDLVADDFLVQDGALLRCASHGALFLPETGECVFGPCVGQKLLKLRCRVDGDLIFVSAPGSLRDATIGYS